LTRYLGVLFYDNQTKKVNIITEQKHLFPIDAYKEENKIFLNVNPDKNLKIESKFDFKMLLVKSNWPCQCGRVGSLWLAVFVS
jgi:hypothetical protein